jgi:hypothetical protein
MGNSAHAWHVQTRLPWASMMGYWGFKVLLDLDILDHFKI